MRDARVISLIGVAHFTSHFFQLAVPPLFPLIKDSIGVSYTELGLAMAVFFTISGFSQVAAGFIVDRFGPQRVLPLGIGVVALATALAGFAQDFWTLLFFAVIFGLGNSVFHPCDYGVLNARVSPGRMARAYSVHNIMGILGWAAAPVTLSSLAARFGWRPALFIVGVLGIAVASCIAFAHGELRAESHASENRAVSMWRLLVSMPILSCFIYFALLSLAQGGMQNFLPTLLPLVQEASYALAASATTMYLIGSATGAVAGGVIADLSPNHERIIGMGLAGAGALILMVGYAPLGPAMLLGAVAMIGFLTGATTPSRDMLVRGATPRGATGKVFGFVYAGLDLGSVVSPLVIGALLDQAQPRLTFVFMTMALAATICTAFMVKHLRRPFEAA